MNLAKWFLAVAALSVVAACDRQDKPLVEQAAAPAVHEVSTEESISPLPAMVELTNYDALVTPDRGGNCALDVVNGAPAAGASAEVGSEARLGGWIGDASNKVPTDASLIFVGLEQSYSAPLVAGGERPDVAASLQADSLRFSGFDMRTRLDMVPGTYRLLILHGPSTAQASCALNATLEVTD